MTKLFKVEQLLLVAVLFFFYYVVPSALNTVYKGFTYEPAGVQNFIRNNLTGGKTKGAGSCRINELVKKF